MTPALASALASGPVIWLVGLPSSGKTTLAEAVIARLEVPHLWLDSDDLRSVMTPAPDYSERERDIFYGTIGHLAVRASRGGVTVIISATANRQHYRDFVRARVLRFAEVHVCCDRDTLYRRDAKGLYARAEGQAENRLPGLGAAFEAPIAPELKLDTTATSAAANAKQIIDWLRASSPPGPIQPCFDRS